MSTSHQSYRIIRLNTLSSARFKAPAQQPQLTYNGGSLLANVQILTIYWGSAWTQQPLVALAQQINSFFQFIVTSSLIDQLTEYSVPAYKIGHGNFLGSQTIGTDPGPEITDAAIQSALAQWIKDPNFPQPNPNTLYFIYFPPGTVVKLGPDASCKQFCGYHDSVGGSVYYAVEPYPGCPGCSLEGPNDPFDSLTVSSSHELCEAITDPVPGKGWYWYQDNQHQGEIGDICEGGGLNSTKQVGNYLVQKEWSNAKGQCV